jgi:protein subunit release factor B
MNEKVKLFSLDKNNFEIQFFRAGGKGGQNQNKVNSACRIVHPASGAVGESREYRDQPQNKKAAFERLTSSDKFQKWLRVQSAAALAGYAEGEKMIEDMVNRGMEPKNLKVEAHTEKGWISI